ncbi:MAG: hypothetical protein M1812_007824 [Candelaria pacifica]|nr:MAG: hypothetical protein M1812_007824 [Candelaria pacifica]
MPLNLKPPLLNSANPWASSKEDLRALYNCPHTGAVTVRTSLLAGFEEDPKVHQHVFFDINEGCTDPRESKKGSKAKSSSLNTLGYSPTKTSKYLEWIDEIIQEGDDDEDSDISQSSVRRKQKKPFILSITGLPDQVVENYSYICNWAETYKVQLLVEINLSCPNIETKPPPAYDNAALLEYLEALKKYRQGRASRQNRVRLGIKIPPYTHQAQFETLGNALVKSVDNEGDNMSSIFSFITATNTLGGCLILNQETNQPTLSSSSGTGIGGLAGPALHPLSLGNVKTLRTILDSEETLQDIEIIGVGGVSDTAGYQRMRSVGAAAVAVGTALGAQGIMVFEKIVEGIA